MSADETLAEPGRLTRGAALAPGKQPTGKLNAAIQRRSAYNEDSQIAENRNRPDSDMYCSTTNMKTALGDFHVEGMMMRYSVFMPRLYNLCKSPGFEPGKILPSRAFCSDESRGYPIGLIAKHFETFPLNHGQVGGIVATDRHGPHAPHGKDLVMLEASHVSYDPAGRIPTKSVSKMPSSKCARPMRSGFPQAIFTKKRSTRRQYDDAC